ncbi:hypothetical protein E4U54_006628 [Claviceps lovelessii]|nr:hypothetical protein E4U54_006628 [Claviceps lovelessii]
MTVNELSNTMDLESTLIRAEALYRKFQRLVEAIDKKQNFPAPRPSSSSSGEPSSGSAEVQAQTSPAGKNKGKETEAQQKVISPELRRLLSRKVDILSRKTVEQKGEGMPGKKGDGMPGK